MLGDIESPDHNFVVNGTTGFSELEHISHELANKGPPQSDIKLRFIIVEREPRRRKYYYVWNCVKKIKISKCHLHNLASIFCLQIFTTNHVGGRLFGVGTVDLFGITRYYGCGAYSEHR